ncbi:MAG: DUF305 domain-containing protein [Gemmatimonadaceae bacterium]|nr:DUF305 domain-containing protein [Gemmatimonadaceae bacterium]
MTPITVWRAALALCVAAAVPAAKAQPVPAGPSVTAADLRFMQEMIGHHQQAVEMTALLPSRTRRADMRTLGERIAISQSDEIAIMRQWLRKHGTTESAAPDAASHTMPGHAMPDHATSAHEGHAMPGMLTATQMQALRAATGARFDRLFLDGMIQHHGGALAMVDSLLTTPGAAQESSLNRFVIDVVSDQRAEIARMRRMRSAP